MGLIKANDIEAEANLFALFLLMPADLLRKEIDKLGGLDLSDDTKMKALCEKFGVTQSAMTVRLTYMKF